MKKIYVSAKALMAAFQFAADKDIRFYLNGVQVEATVKETRIVGTDGHTLGAVRHMREGRDVQRNELDGERYVSFILPRAAIAAMKLTKTELHLLTLTIELDGRQGTLCAGGSRFMFETVDGTYPNYHRVIPEKASGEVCQFNPKYLARTHKAVQILRNKPDPFMHIAHNGSGGIIVTAEHCDDDFVAVIMGWRSVDAVSHAWSKSELEGQSAPELKAAA